jgi:hypothetical protein
MSMAGRWSGRRDLEAQFDSMDNLMIVEGAVLL